MELRQVNKQIKTPHFISTVIGKKNRLLYTYFINQKCCQ